MKNAIKNLVLEFLFAAYRILDPWVRFRDTVIITYHSISDSNVSTALPPPVFRTHLQELRSSGYTFLSLDQVMEVLEGKVSYRHAVAITFDDGYEDFKTNALPILESFGAPATIFVTGPDASPAALGNDISLMDDAMLAQVRSHPLVTVGYHSRTHADLRTLNCEDARKEMVPPFETNYFAYPGGNYTDESIGLARELGYKAAFSIKPRRIRVGVDRYLLPRHVITRTMSMRDIRMRASRVADWYRTLSRL